MNDRIAAARTMQLATLSGDRPWICTVYFVLHEGCLYWLSEPIRRHSRELKEHPYAAAAIVLKQDIPVTGIQVEGRVTIVADIQEAEVVLPTYVRKYGKGGHFVERLKQGANKHELYKLIPEKIMVFDEEAHPDNPYREITL